MDDLQLVRELGADVPLLEASELASARGRLTKEMAVRSVETAPAPDARSVSRLRPWKRKFAWAGSLTVGAAATMATVLLAPGYIGATSTNGSADQGDQAQTTVADPVQVLMLAAAEARAIPFVEPRADQFLYTKEQYRTNAVERWSSIDGTRDGLMVEHVDTETITTVLRGCVDGERRTDLEGKQDAPETEDCQPFPAFPPDLPTDADGMLDYLDAQAERGNSSVNSRAKDILTLAGQYLQPESRAALFEAATKVPGLTLVENAEDAAGRAGVGISWPSGCSDSDACGLTMVFDATSYALLGTTHTAILVSGIVDQVRQTP